MPSINMSERNVLISMLFPGNQRGNLNTRLQKLDADDSPYSALLLAHAGMHRLGWDDRISQVLEPDTMLHAVGQGALAVECRLDDEEVKALLAPLDDRNTRLRCSAERAFMRELEGGCSVPLGVWTDIADADGKQTLSLRGTVCSLDGARQIADDILGEINVEDRKRASDGEIAAAEALGRQLAGTVVAQGAAGILREARTQMPSAPLLQAPAAAAAAQQQAAV